VSLIILPCLITSQTSNNLLHRHVSAIIPSVSRFTKEYSTTARHHWGWKVSQIPSNSLLCCPNIVRHEAGAVTGESHAQTPYVDSDTANGEQDNFIIVTFSDINDLNDPRNWSFAKKISTTLILLLPGLVGGWASANDSTIIPQAQKSFGVSTIYESLSTGLYLIAFGLGSLVAGPFSESAGRIPVYLVTSIILMICLLVSALAPNIETQLAFRFFAGLVGCTAITTYGGVVADLWGPNERTLIFSLASCINFCCVFLSPVVGAFIGESSTLSWRWTEWIALLAGGISTGLTFLFGFETYAPKILSWKAAILRRETGNDQFRSENELKLEPLWRRLFNSTWRPFDMLFHELSVVLFTVYLAVLFIVSFTFLTGYTYLFGDIYGMSQGSVGLCFLGLVVGIVFAAGLAIPLHFKYSRDLQAAKADGLASLPPEDRLWFAIITAPCLPIGLFWMAWTSFPSISYWSSLVGSTLIGVAFLGTFISSYLYTFDAFESSAASALSVGAFVRYIAAGIMVPVSIPMYENLGVHWTLTLLGCISLILTPVPFVMWKFGYVIRKRSRVAKKETLTEGQRVQSGE
jgi:MFS family permease